jgi:hypothetical protein
MALNVVACEEVADSPDTPRRGEGSALSTSK